MSECQVMVDIIQVFVNDQQYEVLGVMVLVLLFGEFGLVECRGVVVVYNGVVVLRKNWSMCQLIVGDWVIVIQVM